MARIEGLRLEIVPYCDIYREKVIEMTVFAWQGIFDEYKRRLGDKMFSDLYGDWKETKTARVISGMTSGKGYVALAEGEIAGFIYYVTDEKKKLGTVEENAVSEEFLGNGIGRKMYEFVLSKMKEDGMIYAQVGTGLDDAHAPARVSYIKAGFDKALPSVRLFKEL
ncbi:MAG: GNAT family N-acetyltransferase [Clostridia bacterium]|nr:GNAT family N-acetyltransferase [Clostridia bacterium]